MSTDAAGMLARG